MKTEALKILREKLSRKEEVVGLWVTLESASVTEMAVALGMDWVIVDAEHGHLDFADILAHIRAGVRSSTVILVRIAELQEGLVKRLLDIGADGIVVPHIETAEALARAISYSKYPPEGIRGIGAERATGWGDCIVQHLQEANENVLVIPIIESMAGGDNIEKMLDVAGAEIFFFGPADYCASAGYAGEWDNAIVKDHISHVKDLIIRSGKHCGILTKGATDIERRKNEGFRMLALGFDTGILLSGLKQALAETGRHRSVTPDLSPGVSAGKNLPDTFDASITPDRLEKIFKQGEGDSIELAPGVICEALVGKHTGAVNLFTAIVTFEPGDILLPAHTHPHSESITLVSGAARVQVEGRSYNLAPLDNITIPRDCAHCVQNISVTEPAVFHIAMPVSTPQRELVENFSSADIYVPDDFNGHKGPER
ncbi:MAG: aldolase/citrate lyase family protein, partial [Bacteroidota bacterium]|nr:aldolase/citrate lyase family protein [Bacteroidota bacterium]